MGVHMKSQFLNYRTTVGLAVTIPFAAFLWLLTINDISATTFTMIGVLLVAAAAVAVVTWRNGQATGSVGQLLYKTEEAPATSARNAPASGKTGTGGR
jgi:hypothetical protein